MQMSRMNAELEVTEPWRKAGFKCKPYSMQDPEDAKRFAKHIVDAADGKEYAKNDGSGPWTAGDVLRGDHEGGTNNPIPPGGAAATRATKIRNQQSRDKQTFTFFLDHILVETLKDFYRSNFRGDPEGALAHFIQNEAGGA